MGLANTLILTWVATIIVSFLILIFSAIQLTKSIMGKGYEIEEARRAVENVKIEYNDPEGKKKSYLTLFTPFYNIYAVMLLSQELKTLEDLLITEMDFARRIKENLRKEEE